MMAVSQQGVDGKHCIIGRNLMFRFFKDNKKKIMSFALIGALAATSLMGNHGSGSRHHQCRQ
ncbi:hypothetical protein [Anaerosporobacter faecicola]|uniref:hypothetical protein n=1 Tax=Anaerosporobacter faecicola TaxID=2718714 RepID=UPI001439780D|nr:hypothetical protein [Anaerosporobacter faecicola]